ncbi:MAG: glycosyltransferase [Bacteroidota bacterium]|nr:glycosyltransferase [Bacteroidota bacterium]
MSPADSKLPVAIFLQRYWGDKMTFVERQLTGLSKDFELSILTPVDETQGQSKRFPIFSKEKNFAEKIYSGLYKKAFSRFTTISLSQSSYWKSLIQNKNIKLIHAHFGPAGVQVLPLAKKCGISLLVSFHGYDASKLLEDKIYLSNLKELFGYEKLHIICVSEYMKKKLLSAGAPSGRITINYYGIPLEEFQFVKRESPLEKIKSGKTVKFLQIANFQEKKGHLYTVKAFRKLLDRQPNCTLTLAGSGPLKDEIESLCKSEAIGEKVFFPGAVSVKDVFSFLENHDIFVHHSITGSSGDQEGIPNAIIEAMATAMPAISTYHAGIPELIEDGLSGFLVNEKDIDSYYKKMEAALSLDDQMGLNAYEKVKKDFNLSKQVEKLKVLYSSLILE